MSRLSELRGEMDGINDKLVALLTRRMDLSLEIAREKQALGLEVFCPEREKEILSRMSSKAGVYGKEAEELFTLLMRLSRSKQRLERLNRICLIGMPGCGKTAIGKALACELGFAFADTDEIVRAETGLAPETYILSKGEAAFRAAEKRALAKALHMNKAVIATGGGIVLDAENRALMLSESFTLYIKRPLNRLALNGRPLSANTDLSLLFETRRLFYEQTARAEIDNEADISAAVMAAVAALTGD